jgi:hypothetical protein
MKKLSVILLLIMVSIALNGQKIIFLHHSTGSGVYNGGVGLPQWFLNYNSNNSTNYEISEASYPDSPYPWANYAYDYWNLWVNNQCNNSTANIYCFDKFTTNYDLIIYKHCYPGADIQADLGTPNVASERKSIENYKLQYRALRNLMDNYPNNKFIVWTLAPLHRNATNAETAARAKQFVDWVKNDWLTEDGNPHNNIFIFDFFGYAAESDISPVNGLVNCLKYEYEGDHNGSDSHPNATANSAIMPLFGQFIVNVIINNTTNVNDLKESKMAFLPKPCKKLY